MHLGSPTRIRRRQYTAPWCCAFTATVPAGRGLRPLIGNAVVHGLVLLLLALPTSGCNDTSAEKEAERVRNLPKTQFEWGMQRLDRALRFSRPSTADGLYTERKMTYELIEPPGESEQYTAKVTVTTSTEFIHAKRKSRDVRPADETSNDQLQPEDPLSEVPDDIDKFLEAKGNNPIAPTVPAPVIEPRTLDSQAVFELAYQDGEWKLLTQPEHKYEQMWFDYAFPKH